MYFGEMLGNFDSYCNKNTLSYEQKFKIVQIKVFHLEQFRNNEHPHLL